MGPASAQPGVWCHPSSPRPFAQSPCVAPARMPARRRHRPQHSPATGAAGSALAASEAAGAAAAAAAVSPTSQLRLRLRNAPRLHSQSPPSTAARPTSPLRLRPLLVQYAPPSLQGSASSARTPGPLLSGSALPLSRPASPPLPLPHPASPSPPLPLLAFLPKAPPRPLERQGSLASPPTASRPARRVPPATPSVIVQGCGALSSGRPRAVHRWRQWAERLSLRGRTSQPMTFS